LEHLGHTDCNEDSDWQGAMWTSEHRVGLIKKLVFVHSHTVRTIGGR
jgi:hypothetical protein